MHALVAPEWNGPGVVVVTAFAVVGVGASLDRPARRGDAVSGIAASGVGIAGALAALLAVDVAISSSTPTAAFSAAGLGGMPPAARRRGRPAAAAAHVSSRCRSRGRGGLLGALLTASGPPGVARVAPPTSPES